MLAAMHNQKSGEDYVVYIMITDDRAVSAWKTFLGDVVSEAMRTSGQRETGGCRAFCEEKLKLLKLDSVAVKYSAVLCGDKLAVTPYTSSGRLEDSPTLDIRAGSASSELYKTDLLKLARTGSNRLSGSPSP